VPTATDVDLLVAADSDLAAALCHFARYSPGSVHHALDGLVLVAGSHPHPGPYRNAALYLGVMDAAEAVDVARAWFQERSRSFVFWSPQHIASKLDSILEPIGQLLEPDGLPQLASRINPGAGACPDGVELCVVTEPRQREDFLAVNAAGWGFADMPRDLAAATFFHPDILDHPNVRAILAYQHGKPVATAAAFVHDIVVGGYWGATIPEARRQGLGELVVRRMWNAGFAMGAQIAVNQASGSGIEIWKRLGFEEITRYRRWLVPPASALGRG